MAPFEASTLVLLHCDDFTSKAPRRQELTQTNPTYPVSINTTTKRFGSGAIDLGNGVQIRGAHCSCRRPVNIPFTLEGWVYVRSNSAESRGLFGLHINNTPLISVTVGSTNKLNGNIRNDTNGSFLTINQSSDVVLNTWVHVAYSRSEDNTLRLFVDGQLAASTSQTWGDGAYTPDDYTFSVGRTIGATTASPDALVDEVRFVAGYCLYDVDFTPPVAAFDDCPPVDFALLYPPDITRKDPAFTSVTSTYIPSIPSLQDIYHGGNGRIDGTVKEKGTPDIPLRRKVRLVRERDGLTIRETWSHPTTGGYAFTNIDRAERYTVISYDYEFNYRAVIADSLQPTLMT